MKFQATTIIKSISTSILLLISSTIISFGQSSGDYGSVASGNWSATSTWKRWNTGTSSFSTSDGTVPSAGFNVFIQSHTVSIDINANCNNIYVGSTGASTLQFDNLTTIKTLSAEGNTTVSATSTLQIQNSGTTSDSIIIKGNLINNGTINLRQSATRFANLDIAGNSVSGNGAYTLNNLTLDGSSLNWSSSSNINIYGNFINNSPNLVISSGGFSFKGTTQYIGGAQQTTFNNFLMVSSATAVTLNKSTIVSGTFSMSGSTSSTTLNMNGYDLNIVGSYLNPTTGNGAFIGNSNSNLITTATSSSQYLNFKTTQSLKNLTIGNTTASPNSYILTSTLNVTGDFTISGSSTASLLLNSFTMTVTGRSTIGNGGILGSNDNTTPTFTTKDLLITSSGIVQSFPTPTVNGKILSINISGNLVNQGTLNLYTKSGANSNVGNITFTGSTDNTMSFGLGSVTDLNTLTVNKPGNTLELRLDSTTLTAQDNSTTGFLAITSGTLKLSGICSNINSGSSYTNHIFSASPYTISALATFWLNNPNVTVAGQIENPSLNGNLKVSTGTMNIGIANGDVMTMGTNSSLTVDGGIVNIAHQLKATNAVTFRMSGGVINVCTASNTTTNPSFGLTSATNTINITGGTINLVNRNTNTNQLDYKLLGGNLTVSGGKLNIGTPTTAANSTFTIQGIVPSIEVGASSTQTAVANANCTVFGDVIVDDGSNLRFANSTSISFRGDLEQWINANSSGLIVANSSTLIINKTTNNLNLSSPISIDALTLTSGKINTSATNLLTIEGTLFSKMSVGSSLSYINGPIRKKFAANASATYTFPIGKSNYQPIEIQGLTATGSGGYATAELFEAAPSGSGGKGLETVLTADRYWLLRTDASFTYSSLSSVRLTQANPPGIGSTDVIGSASAPISSTPTVYNTIGGLTVGNTIQSNKSISITSNADNYYLISQAKTLHGDYSVGESQAVYNNLTDVANDLNQFKVTGNVTFYMEADYNGTATNATNPETFPIVFLPYTSLDPSYTVTIRLQNGVTARETSTTTTISTSLINLAGVKNLSIDGQGRDLAGNPTGNIEWAFKTKIAGNTVPVFLLDKDATYNKLTYLNLEGNSSSIANGTITFGSTSSSTGCEYNTVSFCSIRDRSDIASSPSKYPANAIYSQSTTFINNNNSILNCNISNFGDDNETSAGIFADANNSDWTIQNNSIFQTEDRASVAGAMIMYGIKVNSGSNNDISGNYIGGKTSNCGGGYWKLTNLGLPNSVIGIQCGGSANVNNNKISKIYVESNSTDQTTSGAFCGILSTSGNVNIGSSIGNTIGDLSNQDAIIIDVQDKAYNYAINNTSSGIINIKNNNIGGLSVINPKSTVTTALYLIRTTNGTNTIYNNTIGGSGANNIYMGKTDGTTTGVCFLSGVECVSSSSCTFESNTICNLTSYTVAGAGILRGIYGSNNGTNSYKTNLIYNLTTYNTYSGSGVGNQSSIIGIGLANPTANKIQNVIGNQIYNLINTKTGSILGIYSNFSNTVVSTIKQNNIHNFKVNGSGASLTGIMLEFGTATVQNNMIQLGIGTAGETITYDIPIYGIYAGSADNCTFYYNSVYIGGSGVTSTVGKNTYAFYKTLASTDDIRNNIFCNARSSITSAAGSKHYSYNIAYYTPTLVSDYNIYYAGGNGGILFNINSSPADYSQLRQLRNDFRTQELHSGVGYPYFSNPEGNTSTYSLKLSTSNATPAKGTGIVVASINEDIDGNLRGTNGAPTEIGAAADPGSSYSMDNTVDIFTPVLSFASAPLGNTTPTSGNRTIDVRITDQSPASGGGVDAANPPYIYYRRSYAIDNTRMQPWDNTKSSAGSLISGDVRDGIWRFTIDATSNLYTQSSNDVIEYYFVAQDLSQYNPLPNRYNIWYSKFDNYQPIHASTSNAITYPNNVAVDFYSIDAAIPSNVTVGVGGTFASLTNSGGLFQNMDAVAITNNVTASIISDIVEDGAYPLNAWTEQPAGSNYNLTIVPDGTTTRVLTLNDSFDKDMIRLEGAQRTTFDGSISGSGRYLKFVSSKQNYSVFKFSNDACYNTAKNIELRGNTAQIPKGIILFAEAASTATAVGNDYNTIVACSVSGATSTYENAIYSLGTTGTASNTNNSLISNEISNFTLYGVSIQNDGNGDGWNIIGNSIFYNSVAPQIPIGNTITGIYIGGGSGHTVTGNYIGGQSANCGGSPWSYNVNVAFRGIDHSSTTGSALSIIDNNVIQNINLPCAGANTNSFFAIRASGTPLSSVSGNMIGGTQAINTNNQGISGIWINTPSSGVRIVSNSISKIISAYTGTNTFNGITMAVGITSTSTVQGNIVQNIDLSGCTGSYAFNGIAVTAGRVNTGTGNLIGDSNLANSILMAGSGQFAGFSLNSSSSNSNTITNNLVANISSASNQLHYGIYLNIGTTTLTSASQNTVVDISCTSNGANVKLYGFRSNAGYVNLNNNFVGGSSADKFYSHGANASYGISVASTIASSITNNMVKNVKTDGNGSFTGIDLSMGTSTSSTINANTIQNINITNSGSSTSFSGISMSAGLANITNNTIGHTSLADNIIIAGGANSTLLSVTSATAGTNLISSNLLANIKTTGTASLTGISGKGTTTISIQNDTIRNIITTNTGASGFIGISTSSSTANIGTTTGNTIGGTSGTITNSGTNASFGIYSTSNSATIQNNSITNISAWGSNSTNTSGNNQLTGIYLTSGTASFNLVQGLSCTNASTSTHLAGISSLSNNGSVSINANKIYGLTNSSSSPSATVNGLLLSASTNNITASNNFISLGFGLSTPIFNGVWINQASASTSNIWYNTIDIEGTGTSLTSAAVQRENILAPADLKNNILINNRGNATAYTLANLSTSSWSSDYNDLLTQGTSMKGNWRGSDYSSIASWQVGTSQDANSFSYSPLFLDPSSAQDCDFHIDPSNNCSLNGMATILSVNTDIDNNTRHAKRPDIGADEFTPTGGNGVADFWTGINNTKWDDKENWGCQLVPLSSTNVTIPVVSASYYYPAKNTLIAGSYSTAVSDCNKLILNTGASLSVLPNQSLTVADNFTLNGTFTIKSDATGTGSFLCRGTMSYGSSSSARAERYFPYWSWHYFTPMSNRVNSSQFTNSTGYYNANLITYNENWSTDTDGNGTINYMDGWLFPFPKGSTTANLTPAKGYGILFEGDNTISMTGDSLNNGNYSIPISNKDAMATGTLAHGFNMLGNPYPSSVSAADFLNANAGQIDGAIYLWDEFGTTGWNITGADYAVWNLIGSANAGSGSGTYIPDGHIAPGQAFFVKKTNQGNGSVVFQNAMREQKGTHFFKSKDKIARVKIGVTSPLKHYNETLVALSDDASDDFDSRYDALKIKGNSNLSFFSVLNNKHLAIQALASIDATSKENKTIPLGIEHNVSGVYTFGIPQIENIDPSLSVYFVDKKKNKTIKLNAIDSSFYTTYLYAGSEMQRFELVFSHDQSFVQKSLKEPIKIIAQKDAVTINIELETESNPRGKYYIYDELGRLIATDQVENNSSHTIPLASGTMYLIKVEIGNESKTLKVVSR